MSETKHTPGPWRVEEFPYIHVRSDSGCVLARDYTTDANARLIAAAPTMAAYIEQRAIAGDIEAQKIMEAISGRS